MPMHPLILVATLQHSDKTQSAHLPKTLQIQLNVLIGRVWATTVSKRDEPRFGRSRYLDLHALTPLHGSEPETPGAFSARDENDGGPGRTGRTSVKHSLEQLSRNRGVAVGHAPACAMAQDRLPFRGVRSEPRF